MVRFLLAGVFLVWAGLAEAQGDAATEELYGDWLSTSKRAEQAVEANRASNASFEALRAQIADFREEFLRARDQNSSRIRTLQSQLNALGDKPEEGEEPADIAALRERLNTRLEEMRVPRVVAEEAYTNADGLIREIDRIIRERQADRLLSRGPTPLNPAFWPDAIRDVQGVVVSIANETAVGMKSKATVERTRRDLPVILFLLAIGAILLVRGNRWAERLGDMMRGLGGRGTGVWTFLVSLTKVFLPLAGLLAVTKAISLTGAMGVRGDLVLNAIPKWGAALLVFRWLSDQVYAGVNDKGEPIVPHRRLAEIRLYVTLLALMLIARDAISLLEQVSNISQASRAVLGFVPLVFVSLMLLRFQRIALRGPRPSAGAADEPGARRLGFAGFVSILRKFVVAVSVLAPVLAAVGYSDAAEQIIYPAVLTLALCAAVLVLQRFVVDVFATVTKDGEAARDSLFSTLVGFALALLALPFLALFWGARVADLTEVWAKFLEGFQVGDSRISPLDFATFAAIFAAGYVLTRLLQSGLRNNLLPKTRIDPGGQNAIVSGTGYVGIFLAALIAVTSTGLDLSSLAIVAGALSVGIGFGLQTIVSNFVSGIILLVERPVSKGDWIEVGGQMGYVRDISVRSTRIETFDRTDVIVPNSDLISGTVTNYTRGNTIGRVIAPVGVAYGTDTKRVEAILLEIAKAHPMILANPAPNIVFRGFGADSLDFEIRAILRDVNWVMSVHSDLNHEIAKRFADEGIEIPFAQRDVWLRNPEALYPRPPQDTDGEDTQVEAAPDTPDDGGKKDDPDSSA
ncbi:DUF3772 domain-containing protein [Arenibacterium sp. CAU 1754]